MRALVAVLLAGCVQPILVTPSDATIVSGDETLACTRTHLAFLVDTRSVRDHLPDWAAPARDGPLTDVHVEWWRCPDTSLGPTDLVVVLAPLTRGSYILEWDHRFGDWHERLDLWSIDYQMAFFGRPGEGYVHGHGFYYGMDAAAPVPAQGPPLRFPWFDAHDGKLRTLVGAVNMANGALGHASLAVQGGRLGELTINGLVPPAHAATGWTGEVTIGLTLLK